MSDYLFQQVFLCSFSSDSKNDVVQIKKMGMRDLLSIHVFYNLLAILVHE